MALVGKMKTRKRKTKTKERKLVTISYQIPTC